MRHSPDSWGRQLCTEVRHLDSRGRSVLDYPKQSFTSPLVPFLAAAICHMALYGRCVVGLMSCLRLSGGGRNSAQP